MSVIHSISHVSSVHNFFLMFFQFKEILASGNLIYDRLRIWDG